jgi:hypothetical protein
MAKEGLAGDYRLEGEFLVTFATPMNPNAWRLAMLAWFASAGALSLSLVSRPMLRSLTPQESPPISSSNAPEDPSALPHSAAAPSEFVPLAKGAGHTRKTHHHVSSPSIATTTPNTSNAPTIVADATLSPAIAAAAVPHIAGIKAAAPSSEVSQATSDLGAWISSQRQALADRTGISIHGLLDFGVNYNFKRPATGNNLYRVYDYFGASDFEPNQAELYVTRSVPNQPGFVFDLNFLNTAEVMHGLTSYYRDQPGAKNPTEWLDPTQAYLTYSVPPGSEINLQAGRYTSLIGYEYIPSWSNTNFNQSIDLMYSLGEPFTVTGLRASYAFDKHVAATMGVNDGWDTIGTRNLLQTIEAQIALTPNEAITWNMQGMYGPSTGAQSGSKRGLANTTLSWKTPSKPLQLGFEYLFTEQTAPVFFSPLAEAPGYPNPLLSPSAQPILHSVWWSAIGVWAACSLTDSLQLATRGEWFDDPSGARSGIAQELGEVTETLNYTMPYVPGLTARLEYRHDFSSEHPFPNGGPLVRFPCFGEVCTSTAHTYGGQDTFESAFVLTF